MYIDWELSKELCEDILECEDLEKHIEALLAAQIEPDVKTMLGEYYAAPNTVR
jgi:hypothetical protein